MHYTPNGTEQDDLSEAGLILEDPKLVRHEVLVGGIYNWQFLIPAGAPDYRVDAEEAIKEERLIYDLVPHMHLRGKSFSFTAFYPDGRKEILLDVPRYDFNWQNIYRLAKPLTVHPGTRIECVASYDNSENNLLNPDPSSPVHWGDQTFDEMMVGSYDFSPADQDFALGPPRTTRTGDGRYDVTFRYRTIKQPHAVYLAGTFNGWKPNAGRMSGPDKDGFFTKTLHLAVGRYQYKFVADGQWKTDPGNIAQAGPWNNSVVVVGPLHPPHVAQHGKTFAAEFRYLPPAPCKSVSVVGKFNQWKATANPMQGPDSEGWYTATVELPQGRHEYKFAVDGKTVIPDPGNPVEWGKDRNSVVWAKP